MEPPSPGPVVVVADCPSAAYLPSLVASPALARCMGGARGLEAPQASSPAAGDAAAGGGAQREGGARGPCEAACVIHLAPAEVTSWLGGTVERYVERPLCLRPAFRACLHRLCPRPESLSPDVYLSRPLYAALQSSFQGLPAQVVALPEYRAWMARFSAATTHVVAAAGGGDGQAVMLASAVLQARLIWPCSRCSMNVKALSLGSHDLSHASISSAACALDCDLHLCPRGF